MLKAIFYVVAMIAFAVWLPTLLELWGVQSGWSIAIGYLMAFWLTTAVQQDIICGELRHIRQNQMETTTKLIGMEFSTRMDLRAVEYRLLAALKEVNRGN